MGFKPDIDPRICDCIWKKHPLYCKCAKTVKDRLAELRKKAWKKLIDINAMDKLLNDIFSIHSVYRISKALVNLLLFALAPVLMSIAGVFVIFSDSSTGSNMREAICGYDWLWDI